jgi:hypothetical protein
MYKEQNTEYRIQNTEYRIQNTEYRRQETGDRRQETEGLDSLPPLPEALEGSLDAIGGFECLSHRGGEMSLGPWIFHFRPRASLQVREAVLRAASRSD